SSTAGSPQGGLRLDSTAGIRQGGNSGLAVRAGDPDRSLLLRAIRRTDKNLKMPPGEPLSADIISDFEHWIRDGATMPGDRSLPPAAKQRALWSLEKPRSVPLPQVRNEEWARNDIDRFILSRLEAKGLKASPEADRRALIRRAYFDLTGLPPSAAEV